MERSCFASCVSLADWSWSDLATTWGCHPRLVYTSYTAYMDDTASVREVRENLADVVERATHDELTIITRRGREVAAVVPIEMVREYREWEEERVLRIVNERRSAAQPGVPMDQIMAEVLDSDE